MRKLIFWLILLSFQNVSAQRKNKRQAFVTPEILIINFDTINTPIINNRGVKPIKVEENNLPQFDDYLLLILNQDYDDLNIKDLKWPLNDGLKLKELLLRKYSFEEKKIILLINPNRYEIFEKLSFLKKVLSSNSRLLIFYAGHGQYDETLEEGYWIPKDGKLDNSSNWFSNTELKRYIKSYQAKHVLVIADACFSGSLARNLNTTNKSATWDIELDNNQINARSILTSRKVMTSGSLEQVPDKSFFLRSVLSTLENNNLSYFSADQLFDRVKLSVTSQIPVFSVIPDAGSEIGGEFIFKLKQL